MEGGGRAQGASVKRWKLPSDLRNYEQQSIVGQGENYEGQEAGVREAGDRARQKVADGINSPTELLVSKKMCLPL